MANKIEKLPDGKLHVELETGEKFDGDPLEVTTKLAEAQVNTKRWGQEWKSKAETPPTPTVTPTATPAPTAEEKQLQDYLASQLAASLNLKPEELKSLPTVLATHQQAVVEWRRNNAMLSFQSKHPEFPNSDEASEKLVERAEKDFQVDIDALALANPEQAAAVLSAAHLACVNDGTYKPLSSQQINESWAREMVSAGRAQAPPPPMIPSNSPDATTGTNTEWTMKLDDLRNLAIRQELEGRQR